MTGGTPVVAIVGPTAVGKTGLSIEVAQRVGGEIVSMDSRQLYRGMDVGTAKATRAQRTAVPHFGLDLVAPDERFSAGRFARYARARIAEIEARGRLPMLVGGTGFFLRALTHPIFREPDLDPDHRVALADWLDRMDDEALLDWIRVLDPAMAGRLSGSGGRQRRLRALELPLLTGRSLSWWHANAPAEAPPVEPLVFVLDLPRPILYDAIDRRVDAMLEGGLAAEVAGLLREGYSERSPGLNATGYVELIPHLRGETTLEEAADRIRKNTRAYARRQLTWLRHQLPPGAVWVDAGSPPREIVDEIVATIMRRRRSADQ